MTISSFSQTSYPKKLKLGNDTVIAITPSQLIQINKCLNGYSHLQLVDSLKDEQLSVSNNTIKLKDEIIRNYQKEINLVNEKFNLEKSYSNGLEKQIKQSKRKHLFASFGVGVVGALTGFLAGVILK